MSQRRKALGYLLFSTCVALLSFLVATTVNSVAFWLSVTSGLIASIFALGSLVHLFFLSVPRNIFIRGFQNAALVILSIMIVVTSAEGFLVYRDHAAEISRNEDIQSSIVDTKIGESAAEMGMPLPPQAIANIRERQQRVTFPPEWKERRVKIPQARKAYLLHGVLHVFDENLFRRVTPFPPKQVEQFRVLVVGDSLTYGQAIDEKFIYTSVLQREMEKRFRIEILNLGALGRQSEDILNVVQQFVPRLQPDLVIYGICQNDFLPSNKNQYGARGYKAPLPVGLKHLLLGKTKFARFVQDLYDQSLRAVGLRTDFIDDILSDFKGYQQRFGRDVVQMNRFVVGHKLPPIVGMVLDQFPIKEGRGHRITKVAERYMREAGFDWIDTESYYRRFSGKAFAVKWDGHPDEEGHAIFAAMIMAKLEHHPSVQPYRK